MIRENLKRNIQHFIENPERDELKFEQIYSIQDFSDSVSELGFEQDGLTGDNTNGWQVDFWYYFTHKTYGKYSLSGSLYYGDYSFSKDEN